MPAVTGGDGARSLGPGRGPGHGRSRGGAPGRDRGLLRQPPGQRRASPRRPAPRRQCGGAPGTRHCPAAAAVADLRAPGPGGPGPDRARPRPPCPGGHSRGQNADEGDRRAARPPGLGTLVGEADDLRDRLAAVRGSHVLGASALTGAELRLLPMLCTHLSLPEIGGELFLSPNTIKSQAYSLYRKLEVTTRSQAVTRARELGLVEG